MAYLGDITLEDTIDFYFSTVGTTGAPTTLSGVPVVSAYVGNSLTQLTAGITLDVDFDAVTGLNHVRVAATAANGYTTGTDVSLVITTGTVGGTSVVGYVVGAFSIGKRSAFARIGAAGAGLTNIGTIATVTNLTNLPTIPANWLTAAGIAAGALDGKGNWNIGKTGYALSTAGYEAAADALLNRNVSGGSNAGRTVKQAYHFIRNKWVVAAGTLTVYDTDDITSSWTAAVTGTVGADPVTGSDPA